MSIIEKAEQFVSNLLKDKLSGLYTYHNFAHTERVVKAAGILSNAENVGANEKIAILLAAWFHDTGYIDGQASHEERSAKIFRDFAGSENIPHEISSLAESLIRVTEMRARAETLPEKIIRDADCYHFALPEYPHIAASLRQEWLNTNFKTFSDSQWCSGNLDMLSKWHEYLTPFAIENWKPLKEENIRKLKKDLSELEIKTQKPGEKKKKKGRKRGRGIETLFRTTLDNHTQLSQIADSKANILLSVNAIIISIALSTLIPKLDSPSNAHLVVPTFVLLLFSVVSITFAILSTRPKVDGFQFTREDVAKRNVNLLFFGNFYRMELPDYQAAMKDVMNDEEFLYESLVRDLYLLGKVLNRKYKLLRITYNVFMVGIILSVIAFVNAFMGI